MRNGLRLRCDSDIGGEFTQLRLACLYKRLRRRSRVAVAAKLSMILDMALLVLV